MNRSYSLFQRFLLEDSPSQCFYKLYGCRIQIHTKFIHDAKVGGAVDSLKSREVLQRELDKWKSCTFTNHSKFNKSKFWLLYLGWGNPGWGIRGWRAAPQKGICGFWLVASWTWCSSCPGSPKGQAYPGEIPVLPLGKEKGYSALLCAVQLHLQCQV